MPLRRLSHCTGQLDSKRAGFGVVVVVVAVVVAAAVVVVMGTEARNVSGGNNDKWEQQQTFSAEGKSNPTVPKSRHASLHGLSVEKCLGPGSRVMDVNL